MFRAPTKLVSLLGLALTFWLSALSAKETAPTAGMKTLWQIGQKDKNAAEFALAPGDYAQFRDDPIFLVGVSDPKKDWSYVQPGPRDAWAGERRHIFTICFALKEQPKDKCVLTVALVDAQYRMPPTLGIEINGRSLSRQRLPRGKSDAALNGDPAEGRASEFSIDVPADALRKGMNEIALATLSGSWAIYDSLSFQSPGDAELAALGDFALIKRVECLPALVEKDGKLHQTVEVQLLRHGAEAQAQLKLAGREPIALPAKEVRQELSFSLPAVEKETPGILEIEAGGKILAAEKLLVKPTRKWVMYLLPHSHVDIGYTHLQPDVEKMQWKNLEIAQELAKKSAGNPPGERFKWNAEVLWAVDSYFREAPPEKQQSLVDAIKAGHIELDALYGNELTALCRSEELVRLVEAAGRIGKRCGVKVESAMITDVPGYTWGIVPVLASAGVKYFSAGPNTSSRIGRTLSEMGDRPFYWISPSGQEKVLCWVAGHGYSHFHRDTLATAGETPLFRYFQELERENYPYDFVQMRYSTGGDNGPPDATLVETVEKWNAKYAYPKLVIATTTEMMKDFENRYGGKLPSLRGDITPYWEDGAGSSALETGLNRAAAERLAQAETLWALADREKFPSADFSAAWRNVLLYDEHTWGAHNSVTEPDAPFVKDQWKIKRAFALDADAQSKKLLDKIAAPQGKLIDAQGRFQVCNTCAWPRSDLVILPKESTVGMTVSDADGMPVAAQRLSTGELAFLANDVPALGSKGYRLSEGSPSLQGNAAAKGDALATAQLALRLDAKTGPIKSLKRTGMAEEFVDSQAGSGLNGYLYVLGTDAQGAQSSGPAKISVKESGPLVASLLVESDAPGCNKFTREIRLIDGLDRVDIFNVIDKKPIRKKEGVHLAYPFHVPQGTMHVDLAWAVIRPELDQLPASCKNWYTVNRWVDVSNRDYGVTWATLDAPLVEIGGITANLTFNSGTPEMWLARQEPSQKLYSWVMNNHWYTNYRAEQDGPTPFRYSVRPHAGGYDPVAAMRFGIECSRPLAVVNDPAMANGLLALDGWPDNVIIASMKPSDDGKAIVLRLYEVGGKNTEFELRGNGPEAKAVWLSNPFEEPITPVSGKIAIPGKGVIALRVEF
ncbi:MAG: hypothetical protein IT426_09075 [Pirellulales bacterium]|nr:hypothetical protein [Pirellulales bacterium]